MTESPESPSIDGQILPFTTCYSEVLLTETHDDSFNKQQQRKQVPRTSFHVQGLKDFSS